MEDSALPHRDSTATPSPDPAEPTIRLALSPTEQASLEVEVVRLQAISVICKILGTRPKRGRVHDLLQAHLLAEVGKILDVQLLGRGYYQIEFETLEMASKVIAMSPLAIRVMGLMSLLRIYFGIVATPGLSLGKFGHFYLTIKDVVLNCSNRWRSGNFYLTDDHVLIPSLLHIQSECASKTKLLRESKQHCDAPLKIHYKITEEKLEVSKNIQLPATPQNEEVNSPITQHKAKRGEASKAEEETETLNLEMLQQEFARILKERESLKVQQHELEETKNEVQDAKLTLAAQLRATKEMVIEASITAQKASWEREALERERRLLGKSQKEIEAALSAREAKLSLDEKKLEKDREFLEDEKERAMGIIYKAGQMQQLMGTSDIDGVAAKHLEQTAPVSGKTVPGRAANHYCTDHDTQLHHDSSMSVLTHPNPRFDIDMINLWRENEWAKIEREEKVIMDEISRLHCQNQDDIKQSGLRELSNDLEVASFPSSRGVGGNSYHRFQRDLAPSLEALQLPRQGSCEVHAQDIYQPVLDEPSDGFFSGSETAFSRGGGKQHLEEMERMHGNHDIYYQDVIPSQNRLENVMQSLVSARQASRSRLHRTKTLLQSLPLTGGGLVITEVQQALCALTERLYLMEQMEDELADELREAYRAALPDSEGIIVDKVELLCKMEEQQTLRAEWEEDMQCQLEKISILQANSQASSCFSTPIKRTVFDRIVSPPSTNQSMR